MVFKREALAYLPTAKQRDFIRYLFEKRRRQDVERELEQVKANLLKMEEKYHEATNTPEMDNKRALREEIYRQNMANKKHKKEKEELMQLIIELRKQIKEQ